MDTQTYGRKKAFKAALALAGVTAKDWAAQRNVTPVHLHYVLNAARVSAPLNAEIDAFIEAHRRQEPARAA